MCYSLTTQGADNEANNTVNYNLYMHYTNIVYVCYTSIELLRVSSIYMDTYKCMYNVQYAH